MGVDLNVNNQINLNLNPNINPLMNQLMDMLMPRQGQTLIADLLKGALTASPNGVPNPQPLQMTPQAQMMQGISLLLQGMGRQMETRPAYNAMPTPQAGLGNLLNSMGDGMQGIADFIGMLQGNLGKAPPMGLPGFGPGPVVSPFANPTPPTTQRPNDDALKTIDKNFEALAKGKDHFDKKDLEAAAKNTKNPELASAAKYLLDNPMLLNGMDTAYQDAKGKSGKNDGKFSRADVTAALSSTKNTVGEQNIIDTLLSHSGEILKDGKGTISKESLETIATKGKLPNGKDAPADLQAAVKSLLANPALFDKLDSAFDVKTGRFKNTSGLDKEISLADLQISAEKRSGPKPAENPNPFTTGAPLMENFSAMLLGNLQRQGADPNMLNMLQLAIKAA